MSIHDTRVIGKRTTLKEVEDIAIVQVSNGTHRCDIPTSEIDSIEVPLLQKPELEGGYPEGAYLIMGDNPRMKLIASYENPANGGALEREAWTLETSAYNDLSVPGWTRNF